MCDPHSGIAEGKAKENSGIRLHRGPLIFARLCSRSQDGKTVDGFFSRDAGGRTARWKFEAVGQIVRLLDTIEAPGSPGHLSRPSDEG